MPRRPNRRPTVAQRARVEERHAAVVAAHRQQAPVGLTRVVEDPLPGAAEHGERRGAAQQRGEQVAAGGEGVVEVDALARKQQRPVEARLHERLGAEPLRDCRGRPVPRGSPRREARRAPGDHGQESSTSAAASRARSRLFARCRDLTRRGRGSRRGTRRSRRFSVLLPSASAHSSAAARRAPR